VRFFADLNHHPRQKARFFSDSWHHAAKSSLMDIYSQALCYLPLRAVSFSKMNFEGLNPFDPHFCLKNYGTAFWPGRIVAASKLSQ
jgi:hypothetical protein